MALYKFTYKETEASTTYTTFNANSEYDSSWNCYKMIMPTKTSAGTATITHFLDYEGHQISGSAYNYTINWIRNVNSWVSKANSKGYGPGALYATNASYSWDGVTPLPSALAGIDFEGALENWPGASAGWSEIGRFNYSTSTRTPGETSDLKIPTGYHLTKWRQQNGSLELNLNTNYRLIKQNFNFIPIAAANTYTIAYNNNDGYGTIANQSATYDTILTLSTGTAFAKDGYRLKCWNTQADGQGTNYDLGAAVSNLTSTNNATVTLYAIWEPEGLYVKVDNRWRVCREVYVKVNGEWKLIDLVNPDNSNIYVKINGSWKPIKKTT